MFRCAVTKADPTPEQHRSPGVGDAGVETIEWIATAAIIIVLLAALTTFLSGEVMRAFVQSLVEWVAALFGPTPSVALRSPNSVVKLLAIGLLVLIALAVISRFLGTPWERDLSRTTTRKPRIAPSSDADVPIEEKPEHSDDSQKTP